MIVMLIVVLGLVPVSSMYSTWSDKFSSGLTKVKSKITNLTGISIPVFQSGNSNFLM